MTHALAITLGFLFVLLVGAHLAVRLKEKFRRRRLQKRFADALRPSPASAPDQSAPFAAPSAHAAPSRALLYATLVASLLSLVVSTLTLSLAIYLLLDF